MKGLLIVVFSGLVAVALCIVDPRTQTLSQCKADNRRNCTMNQICVERRIGERAIHQCVDRIMMDQSCMKLDTRESPEAVNRERQSGTFTRGVTSMIDGRMPTECFGELVCRNNTCQARPTTACNTQRRRNSQVCCDEDGMFNARQCRRMANETSVQRPSALMCGCVNRMTGQMSNRMTVKTRDSLPNCGRNCSFMNSRRNITVRHGESISRPRDQNRRCEACRCNDGMLEQCAMLPNRTCAGQRQPTRTCRSSGNDVQEGEEKKDGACNKCRCVDGILRCTALPGCRPNSTNQEKDDDLEKNRMQCDACMDENFDPVCVPRQGRTFPTRCHAMMCANVSRENIMPGACRDNDPCTNNPCSNQQRCFRTGSKTQMSNTRDRPEERRECVNLSNLNCATTRTKSSSTGAMERLIDRPSSCNEDEEKLPRNRDSSKTRDEDRVVCGNSNTTFPSTCHMVVESTRSDNQVRHPGPCRNIDQSEMVCGTDGVTYRSMDIMQTQGGNVRMDYRGACMNVTNANTMRNRCEMVRKNNRCPSLDNCNSRSNTSDGCCPICGGVMGMALKQGTVEEYGDSLTDLDDLVGRMQPLFHRDATTMCNISIVKPANAVGDVAEMVFQARNMSMGMSCRMHAMNLADRLNKAGDNNNIEPVTVAEDVIAAAAVAPQLEETASGSIPFVASPIMILCLMLLKAFFN